MKLSKIFISAAAGAMMATPVMAQSAGSSNPDQLAISPPVFLQLEITSACTDKGAEFKVINRGSKWPQTGFLRLYHSDERKLVSERRIRLAEGQKVSFIVRDEISQGRPVGIWIEPEWYEREFTYDANVTCR